MIQWFKLYSKGHLTCNFLASNLEGLEAFKTTIHKHIEDEVFCNNAFKVDKDKK
jgi:hypothetical protein